MNEAGDNEHADGVQAWQRPPFEPGHELSVRHGAYSPKIIGVRAEEVRQRILRDAPHLDEPDYQVSVELLARAVARSELIAEYVEERGVGNVSSRLLETASASDNTASKLAIQLGMDPRSRAELLQIKSQTMALLVTYAPTLLEALDRTRMRLGIADEAWTEVFGDELKRIERMDDGDR